MLEKSIQKSLEILKKELQKYENSSKIANNTLAFFTYTPKLINEIELKIKNSENILFKNLKSINVYNTEKIAKLNDDLQNQIFNIEQEIDKKGKVASENLNKLIKQHRNSNLRIKEDKQTIETLFNEKNNDYDVEFKREKGTIEKSNNEIKESYNINTNRLETQHKKRISSINTSFEEKISLLKQEIQEREIELSQNLQDIESRSSSYNNEKDQNYYDIKSTHSKTSIFVNEKINAEKSVLSSIIQNIDNDYIEKLKPFVKKYEDINNEEEKELVVRSEHYAEQLKSLNYIFDYNNEQFTQKKKDLNKKVNNEITLLNTQLNEIKDVYSDEKKAVQKLSHDDDLDKFEKKKHRKEEEQLVRKLNKAIVLVNKNIHAIQKDYQVQLFELEKNQLQELRNWRLKKSIYEYNYNSDREIIKLRYNFKREQVDSEKEQLEIQLKYYKKIAEAASTLNMLPLEVSILTASSVQEREINILGAEVEYRNSHFNLLKNQLKLEFEIEKSKLNLQINILQEQQYKELKSANISTQLSLEKERIKRNYRLKEQSLRVQLATLNLEFKRNQNEIERDLSIIEIDEIRRINLVNHQKNVTEIKASSHIESLNDKATIQNARYKHQLNINDEKFKKDEASYHEMLVFHYSLIKQLTNIFYSYFKEIKTFISFFDQIYLLPAHADTINLTVDTIKNIINHFNLKFSEALDTYKKQTITFFDNQIETLKTYSIDHENEMILTNISHRINITNEKINDLVKRKESRESRLNELKSIFHSHQQTRNNAELEYENSNKTSSDLFNYRKELRLAKRNEKKTLSVISNVESTIKSINTRIEKLTGNLDDLNKKYQKSEQKLLINRDNEINELTAFREDLIASYQTLETYTNLFNSEIEKGLSNIISFYLTEKEYQVKYKILLSAFNLYHKQLTTNEQTLFNKILSIYKALLNKQHAIKDSYNKSLLMTSKKVNDLNQKNISNQKKKLDTTFMSLKKAKIKITTDTLTNKNALLAKQDINSLNFKEAYNDTQLQITKNNNSQRNSLFVMNENIKAVLKEFADAERKNINDLQIRNSNFVRTTKSQVNKQIRDLRTFHTNTKNKTKDILQREANNQKKFKLQLTQKTNKTEKAIENYEVSKENDINNNNLNLIKSRNIAQNKLDKIEKSKNTFKNNEFSKMNSLYKSNVRELRKNYRFKIKALKL